MANLGNVNRQYVGARYVPNFYDNNGSAEWIEGVVYEPLTIVTYLGNSYTSKVPVPSNAGAPNVATEYWALTGNYNAQVADLTEKVTEVYGFKENMNIANVLDFGAVADGVADCTYAFNQAIASGKTVYVPDGKYALYPLTTSDTVSIIGESPNVEIYSLVADNTNIINIEDISNAYIKNLTFVTGIFRFYTSGAYINSYKNKNLWIENVTNKQLATDAKLFICNPKPETYATTSAGYPSYPLEISNFSGYNAININNVLKNDDGSVATAADNSALGITDSVISSSPTVFIRQTGGDRDFLGLSRVGASVASEIRPQRVFEVNQMGHLAIGCSALSTDPCATGSADIKVRDTTPQISLYTTGRNFFTGRIGANTSDGIVFSVTNASGAVYNTSIGYGGWNQGIDILCADEITDYIDRALAFKNTTSNTNVFIYVDDDAILRSVVLNKSSQLNHFSGYELTAPRPVTYANLPNLSNGGGANVGAVRFDTTNGKPCWWNGSSWVLADGTVHKSF